MNNIKICHVTSVHKRYDNRIFYKECTSLVENGFDVTLIVNDELDDEIKNEIKIISTMFSPKNRIERILKSKKLIKEKILEVDANIYHLHDPELITLIAWLKRKGKKVIFDSHELSYIQIKEKPYIPKMLRNLISNTYRAFEARVLKNADAVIFPCKINGEDPFKNISNRTVFIDNFPIVSEDRKINLSFEDKICYVGGFSYARGITHLIKAAYKANVKLVLCGRFISDEYYNEVRNLEEYSIVEYKGFLDKENLIKEISSCTVGMSTLLNIGQYNTVDNLPTKVLEYLEVGIPVITSKYPFSQKFINKYSCGYVVDPENIEEIASKIKYLIENKTTATKMGMNGRQAVLEKYNWNTEVKKLVDLYRELITEIILENQV